MSNKKKMEPLKQEKQERGLSLAGQFTQADIPNMLVVVKEKIAQLTKGTEKKISITVTLPGFGDISKVDSVMTLLCACSSVEGKSAAYNNVAEKYLPAGTTKPAFTIAGHSASVWLEFLQERINEVSFKNELEKLRKVQKTLEENLSQEAKLANDLKKIASILEG